MAERVLQGDPDITLTLRRSARARRLTLRISRVDGRVTLTLPTRTSEREALAFAREKHAWICKHLEDWEAPAVVGLGSDVPVQGEMCRIVPGQGRAVTYVPGFLQVPGAAERVPARILGYLKTRARDRLAAASDQYAAQLGRPYSGISLRDTRSRWGSCSSAGRLMYSWRLIMAPPAVLDYVVAHEVAHLAQMNHSPAFWAEVARIHGPYAAPRQWLRQQGNDLHRYRFGD
ncbi:MAG: SprT family zinc-dependent metalloprotease [Pseudomonadota bacterium]